MVSVHTDWIQVRCLGSSYFFLLEISNTVIFIKYLGFLTDWSMNDANLQLHFINYLYIHILVIIARVIFSLSQSTSISHCHRLKLPNIHRFDNNMSDWHIKNRLSWHIVVFLSFLPSILEILSLLLLLWLAPFFLLFYPCTNCTKNTNNSQNLQNCQSNHKRKTNTKKYFACSS